MYTTLKPRSVVSGLGRKGVYLFRKPRTGGLPGDGPLVHFTKGRQTSKAGFLGFDTGIKRALKDLCETLGGCSTIGNHGAGRRNPLKFPRTAERTPGFLPVGWATNGGRVMGQGRGQSGERLEL